MGQLVIPVQIAPTDRFGSLPPSERKQKEREQVAEFIASRLVPLRAHHHVRHGRSASKWRHRILSMPSNNWEFETLLLRRLDCEFLCIEHDRWRAEQGRVKVPFATGRQEHEVLSGYAVTRGFAPTGDTQWSVFHADLASILGIRRQEKGDNRERRRWRDLFKHWSAAWIDFTGPLTERNLLGLRRVWSHLNMHVPYAPVVISYGVGRERGLVPTLIEQRGGDRSQLVLDALRDSSHCQFLFKLLDVQRHRGAGRQTRETLYLIADRPSVIGRPTNDPPGPEPNERDNRDNERGATQDARASKENSLSLESVEKESVQRVCVGDDSLSGTQKRDQSPTLTHSSLSHSGTLSSEGLR